MSDPTPKVEPKICWACRSDIHDLALRCKECGSFQGWMRWIGTTNLVGLIAILGTIVGIWVGLAQINETEKAIVGVAEEINELRQADRLREELHSLGPTKQRIADLVELFQFNSSSNTSIDEAKLLMAFLNPIGMGSRGHGDISGRFGELGDSENYEITIWINTYEKADTYGIRFGFEDGAYFRCNDSYFEITKLSGQKVSVALNPGPPAPRAPCSEL